MKIFIYGCNGIGKTTFAAEFEKPILIDLEGSAHHLEIDRYSLSNYQDVDDFLLPLKKESHPYKMIIIDSVDVWNI
jgi:predicted AAA+ superfamily ATPase